MGAVFGCSGDPAKRFHEDGSWAGDVDALESISFRPEKNSFIEKDTSLIQHQFSKLMIVQAKGSAVEPDKVGPLGTYDPDFRKILLKKTGQGL